MPSDSRLIRSIMAGEKKTRERPQPILGENAFSIAQQIISKAAHTKEQIIPLTEFENLDHIMLRRATFLAGLALTHLTESGHAIPHSFEHRPVRLKLHVPHEDIHWPVIEDRMGQIKPMLASDVWEDVMHVERENAPFITLTLQADSYYAQRELTSDIMSIFIGGERPPEEDVEGLLDGREIKLKGYKSPIHFTLGKQYRVPLDDDGFDDIRRIVNYMGAICRAVDIDEPNIVAVAKANGSDNTGFMGIVLPPLMLELVQRACHLTRDIPRAGELNR